MVVRFLCRRRDKALGRVYSLHRVVRRFGSNRCYMGTKRALKRDLPGSHAQSGLLVKGSFRGKSKQWPVWCAEMR